MACNLLLVAVSVALMAASAAATASGNAECTIFWQFPQRCEAVETAITTAINNWNTNANCVDTPAEESCDYMLIGEDATGIRAYRVSFPQGFVYDLGFTIHETGNSNCLVTGHSFSTNDIVSDDKGTNYCNLENIIVASGLTEKSGYSQVTNDGICTDYSTANCVDN